MKKTPPPRLAEQNILGEWAEAKTSNQEEEKADVLGMVGSTVFRFLENGKFLRAQLLKGSFKTDESKDPSHIDLRLDYEGSQTQKGIFRFTERGLQMCIAAGDSRNRPTAFKDSPKQQLWSLVRPGDQILVP